MLCSIYRIYAQRSRVHSYVHNTYVCPTRHTRALMHSPSWAGLIYRIEIEPIFESRAGGRWKGGGGGGTG